MSYRDYSDERQAQCFVLGELCALGWQPYGYTEDKSDSMSDYYSPETWDGVATHPDKPGLVICVSVSKYTVNAYSGKPMMQTQIDTATPCTTCSGSGAHPNSPFTLKAARENPQAFNEWDDKDRNNGSYSLLRDVVSPLYFLEDGRFKCRSCHGAGIINTFKQVQTGTWPTFQATPKGMFWHVERNGKIIAQGRGKQICCRAYRAKTAEAQTVVNNIIMAVDNTNSKQAPRGSVTQFTVRRNEEKNGVELVFPAKPSQDILDKVKAAGFRWSRFSGCWYKTYSEEALSFANSLMVAYQ